MLQRFPSSFSSPVYIHSRRYGYVHVPKKTIPHLLGHGNAWRKCFVVHPSTQAIDSLQKYQWLTGTRVVRHLPELFNLTPAPDESVVHDLKQRLMDYILQMTTGKKNWQFYSELSFGLFQAILPSLWQLGCRYSHIKHSYWSLNASIECYWRKHDVNYITFTNPLAVLYVPASLQLLSQPDDVIVGDPPPELHPSHIGLFEHSFDEINVSGGNKRHSPYPLAHTLLVNNSKRNTLEQTTSHALMQLFAQSAAQAIQNGYPLDCDLNYQLSTQAILTDGQIFTFACYQLNTLDFTKSNPDKISNVFWIGPTLQLYDSQMMTINEDCLVMILKFLLNRTLRKGPSKSGFRKDT